MPIIRPISDLRNNFSQIEELCHRQGEPVFITKNGVGDLVVMSLALYEQQQALLDLYRKLGEAEAEAARGESGISHDEMIREMRSRLHGQRG